MSTILTDDERPKLPMPRIVRGTNPHCYSDLDMEAYADAREVAVLAKLAQQEPGAWLVCSINKDGSPSLEYAAAWKEAAHEHINDAIAEGDIEDAASWVVRPVYTHPAPQQADRQRVPDGHVLVPVKPTDKMVDAAIDAGWSRIDIYQAMLAAAPEAPAQEGGST